MIEGTTKLKRREAIARKIEDGKVRSHPLMTRTTPVDGRGDTNATIPPARAIAKITSVRIPRNGIAKPGRDH